MPTSIAEMNEPLATKIRKILEQRGFSQTAIARKAGYSRQDLSYMLNGRKIIKVCDIVKIAKAMQISPEDLFKE